MDRGILRALAAGTAAAVIAMLPSVAAPSAWAADASTLQVESVAGQDLTLLMTVDPKVPVSSESSVRGSVEVAGVVVPAVTSLTVPTAPSRAAILVLDTSGSMKGQRIADARAAATSFVESMPADVKVGLVTFSKSADVVAAPTLDRAAVVSAIEAAKTGGRTALYDGIKAGLDLVPPGTDARLLVLSDGEDTLSRTTLAEINDAVASSGTPVDVVALNPSPPERTILGTFADSSGGTLHTARDSAAFADTFRAVSESFRPTVTLRATLPPLVKPSGKPITATAWIDDVPTSASTTLPVVVEASPQPTAAPSGSTPAPAPGSGMLIPLLFALIVFSAAAVIGLSVVTARHRRKEVARVQQVLRYEARSSSLGGRRQRWDAPAERFPSIDAFLARHTNVRKVRAQLGAAGFNMTPADWLVVRLLAAVGVGLLLAIVFGSPVLGLLLGPLLVWLLSRTLLRSRSARRQRAFADELSNFLMLLASGIRAGLSFAHALDTAAEDATGEMGRQMRRVLRELSVGASLDEALLDCADRMDNEDLRWLVTALSIQREVGGNLSTILDGVAQTIKARDELRREVRTLSAEGRLSGYVLIALPVGVFAFLLVFRTSYVSVLWTDPRGIIMLVGLAIAFIVGWFWMRAIVRIKV